MSLRANQAEIQALSGLVTPQSVHCVINISAANRIIFHGLTAGILSLNAKETGRSEVLPTLKSVSGLLPGSCVISNPG